MSRQFWKKNEACSFNPLEKYDEKIPIASMDGIFTYIYHKNLPVFIEGDKVIKKNTASSAQR